MFKWLGKLAGSLFGSSDKGLVGDISDAVDRWSPSATTRHKMSLEDMKAGDSSQESARGLVLRGGSTWFDNLIDGLNRLVRPVLTFWVFGILTGMLGIPTHLLSIPPMLWNIIWTIVTFWFGSRMVFKDIPKMFNKDRKVLADRTEMLLKRIELLEEKLKDGLEQEDKVEEEDLAGG